MRGPRWRGVALQGGDDERRSLRGAAALRRRIDDPTWRDLDHLGGGRVEKLSDATTDDDCDGEGGESSLLRTHVRARCREHFPYPMSQCDWVGLVRYRYVGRVAAARRVWRCRYARACVVRTSRQVARYSGGIVNSTWSPGWTDIVSVRGLSRPPIGCTSKRSWGEPLT